jgi:hypothetical protein
MLLQSLMIAPCRRRQPSLQRACVDGTHSRIPSLGADPEVFLLIRATLDRLNLRVKPADAVLEGGVLAAPVAPDPQDRARAASASGNRIRGLQHQPYGEPALAQSGGSVHLKELAGGHRCCTFCCTGRKVQQLSKGKPALTRGGAKGDWLHDIVGSCPET